METTGRKNAAGGWLRGELLRRIASAGMLFMAVAGFTVGFLVRGLPQLDGALGGFCRVGRARSLRLRNGRSQGISSKRVDCVIS